MQTTNLPWTLAAFALGASALLTQPAHAHINMKGALKSRGGDQKMSPCDGARSAGPVYTFEPGATITLAVDETIPHPSYFRIAFDNDGENGFVEPASIKPIDPARKCPYNDKDQCGEPDFCNNETVLWDNLDPHVSGGSSWSWNVKLPDVECENCTIQVLQIMEDVVHGAYCPTGSCEDDSLEDIYHRCINIKLKKGATNSPGTTTAAISNKGMECPKTVAPPAGEDAGVPATPSDAGVVASTDAGAPRDGGSSAKPAPKDAGATTAKPEEEEEESDEAPTGGKKDAGSTKKDAGHDDEDHEDHDDAEKPPADDGGCSVAAGSHGNASSVLSLLLTLAAGLVLRRRGRPS